MINIIQKKTSIISFQLLQFYNKYLKMHQLLLAPSIILNLQSVYENDVQFYIQKKHIGLYKQKMGRLTLILVLTCIFCLITAYQPPFKYVSTPLLITRLFIGYPQNCDQMNAHSLFSRLFSSYSSSSPYTNGYLDLASQIAPLSSAISPTSFSSIPASNSYAKTYEYQKMDQTFRTKIENSYFITKIELYSSPLEMVTIFHHYQVHVELDNLIWAVISFSEDGLQVGVALTNKQFVNRRNNNMKMDYQYVKTSTKKLRQFLIQNQHQRYHTLNWNCQDYSIKLWNHIVK